MRQVDAHGQPTSRPRERQCVRLLRHPGHADWRVRLLVRLNVEAQGNVVLGLRYGEAPVLVLVQAGLGVVPDLQHQVNGCLRHRPMVARSGNVPEDLEVAGEAAGPDTPVKAALGHVVQLRDSVRDDEGVVVGHARDAGAKDDVLRQRQRLRDEKVRRGDVLPRRGEVLTNPCLFVPELVQRDDLLQVVLQGLGQVGPRRVHGHGEVADFHGVWPPSCMCRRQRRSPGPVALGRLSPLPPRVPCFGAGRARSPRKLSATRRRSPPRAC